MEIALRNWMAVPVLAFAASLAHAETYAVDPDHTRATFEISHFGYSTFRGRFDKSAGTIAYDPAAKTGSADVTFDVKSASTGAPKLDEHLQAEEFFNAAKFPTLAFKSTSFVFDGNKLKSIDGNLTMRGVTKPVSFKVNAVTCNVHPMLKVPACGADAETKIKRSDFGVSAYIPQLGDEVTLRIGVEAHGKKK